MPTPTAGQQFPASGRLPSAVVAWIDRLAVWPVIVAALAVMVLVLVDRGVSYEQPMLLRGLNFVCATLVPLFAAFWIGRIYLRQGRPGLLLLGCGFLFWGLAGLAGAWFNVNSNVRITIHNTAVWLSAFCHLTGVAISIKLHETTRKPQIWLIIGYLGVVMSVLLITLATTTNRMPLFFLPGQGGTATRHLVLGSAIAMFVLTAMLVRLIDRAAEQVFTRWYSLGVLLLAIGLVAVLFQKTTGSIVSWGGRSAHYLGGVYMLVGILRSAPRLRPTRTILEQATDGTVPQLGLVVAVAVASAASAGAVRMFFFHELGTSLSYLTFFPAVILSSFVGGFGSGVLTTLLSILLVCFFWTGSFGSAAFPLGHEDVLETLLFSTSSLLVALVARTTRKAQEQAVLARTEAHRISEQLAAAETLRASERRFVYVIEATDAGVWDWNVQTGALVLNERWAEMTGYTQAELEPISIKTWYDMVHPEDRGRSDAQLAQVFANQRLRYDLECRIRHRDGHWVWIRDRGKVIEWTETGQPLRMIGSHVDISDRKKAEQQLSAVTQELQAIVEAAPIGIVKVIDRQMLWSNRGMEELFGYSREEMFQQNSRMLYAAEEDWEALGQAAYPILAQGGIYEAEHQLLQKNGAPVCVRLTGRAIDSQNLSTGSIWILRDISHERRMQEAIRERERNLNNLVENASDMVVVATKEGQILFANQRLFDTLGYDKDELASMHLLELHPSDLRQEAEEIFTVIVQGKQAASPLPVANKRGEVVPVEIRAVHGTWNGRDSIFGFIRDLSAEQEAQQRFERLFRRNPAPMALTNIPDRQFIDVNQAFEATLGYAKDEVIGKTSRELGILSTGIDAIDALARRAFAGIPFANVELRVIRKDGALLHGLFSGEKIHSQGRDYLLTVMIDITDRIRMEAALKEHDAQLAAIIENQPGLVWLKDCLGRFLAVNAKFARSCSRNHPEEVIGLTDFDIWPPDLARHYVADDQQVIRAGNSMMVEEPVFDQKVMRWFETFKTPIFDESGQVIGTTGYAHDITDRKQTEQVIRESEERLKAATLAANLGVFTYAFDGSHAYFSPEFLALTGMAPDRPLELTSNGILQPVHPDDLAAMLEKIHNSCDPDGPGFMDHDHRVIHPSGKVRWLRTMAQTYFSGSGAERCADRAVGIVQDITDRKQMEKELQRSQQAAVAAAAAKSTLLSTVAHEFRTPLSLLQSSLDILDRYGNHLSAVQREEQNRHIRNATQQLKMLAETVLTYRTMEVEERQPTIELCNIGALSRTIANEVRAAWAQGHAFTLEVGPECGEILITPGLYRRVLENLLTNAFQYTPPDRSVSVRLHRDGDQLRLTVVDQGIGVEVEEKERIFDSFYRGQNVGPRRGMGLGLSIVRDAVVKMGGTVSLTSTDSEGTVFEVVLPWREG